MTLPLTPGSQLHTGSCVRPGTLLHLALSVSCAAPRSVHVLYGRACARAARQMQLLDSLHLGRFQEHVNDLTALGLLYHGDSGWQITRVGEEQLDALGTWESCIVHLQAKGTPTAARFQLFTTQACSPTSEPGGTPFLFSTGARPCAN